MRSPPRATTRRTPPASFRRVHRFNDEFLHPWINVEALAFVSGPVLLIGPHPVQPLLHFRVAAGEPLHERAPARRQRLRLRSRRILTKRRRHVGDERRPLLRDLRLQLRVPERLALFDLRLRVLTVVPRRLVGAVLHFDLPHNGLEQVPVRIAAAFDGAFRLPDRLDRQIKLPPFPGQHLLLTPQRLG